MHGRVHLLVLLIGAEYSTECVHRVCKRFLAMSNSCGRELGAGLSRDHTQSVRGAGNPHPAGHAVCDRTCPSYEMKTHLDSVEDILFMDAALNVPAST
jgi:hypothetical protein